VLYNLLQNARNHTQDGNVRINAQFTMHNAQFKTHNAQSVVTVTVADTGEGIAPDILPRVFERGVTGKNGGMGIGLAVCKELIESNGGEIWIESELGKGTTVRFTIPMHNAQFTMHN
jgi:signal transduction histidine kinase